MSKSLWVKLLCCLSLVSFSVAASRDISNAEDYAKVERFPESFIVQYQQQENSDYRLALGGLEKINGVLAPEREQRLRGDLTRITYRIPENHSPEEAFEFVREQLNRQGAEQLYHCIGRDCGSSNQWANNIFRYSRLYGVDRTQRFASFRLADTAYMLYAVQRGNKRVYLRLDVLDTASGVEQNQPAAFSGGALILAAEQNISEQLIALAQQHQEQQFWIVAYDFNAGSASDQLQRSQQHIERIKQSLVDNTEFEGQFNYYAAGGFNFPGASSKGEQNGVKIVVYKNASE